MEALQTQLYFTCPTIPTNTQWVLKAMFELELNEDSLIRGYKVLEEALLYFASGNYHKNVYWSIGILIYISKYLPKIENVRYFNNLC